MKLSRRGVSWLLGAGVCLCLAFLLREFLLANIVIPIALMLWVFWRLVLSVHQAVYWGALALLAGSLALYRLAQVLMRPEAEAPAAPDSLLAELNSWRTALQLHGTGDRGGPGIRRRLGWMLVALYAAKRPETTAYKLHEALEQRQEPLPDSVHTFLFPDAAKPAKLPWWRRLAGKPAEWFGQASGRDRAVSYESIEDTLAFMEALMEIEHGDEYFDRPDR